MPIAALDKQRLSGLLRGQDFGHDPRVLLLGVAEIAQLLLLEQTSGEIAMSGSGQQGLIEDFHAPSGSAPCKGCQSQIEA